MAKPDWAAIEIDYRAGQLSNRAMAEKYGVSDTAIRKKAKQESWVKPVKSSHKEVRTANQNANLRTSAEELIDDESLTPLQALFVLEYVKDKNGVRAAIRAGYSEATAQEQSSRLLSNVKVSEAINRQLKAIATAHLITAEKVVEHMWNVATANPNELIDHRIVNCRYCHGIDHNYQWGKEEYRQAQEKAELRDKDPPDCSGGFGFDELAEPNPNCPECHGRGKGRVVPHDTRKLGEKGLQLLAGVKLGKDGLEIKMHDQMKALEAVAKHLNLFTNQQAAKAPDQDTPEDDGISDDYRLELKPDEAIPDKPIL